MIERNLLSELREHLVQKEISMIVGPRQAGKTTLMNVLKQELEAKKERCLFLSLDIEEHNRFFSSQVNLLQKFKIELGNRGGYIFIDEIQRKENAGLFLKGLYDMNLPYKFIVSGSGSIELKEKIHESLLGRKRLFELSTVSFDEFVNYKTDSKYAANLDFFFHNHHEKTLLFLQEYLNYGGYPRIVLEEKKLEKRKHMDEIFRSYIERDITYFLKVEKIESFRSLFRLLAGQTGQLINYSELSNTLGISTPTLKNYIWYLQATYIIQLLPPYFTNTRKEITKSPVAYFFDLGLRNYGLGLLGNLTHPQDYGYIFENFIHNLLKQKLRYTGTNLNFWRTKDKAEVEFIINYGRKTIPLEIKYRSFKKAVIGKSLRNYIAKYSPEEAYIVNLDYQEALTLKGTRLQFVPFWKLYHIEL